MRRFRRTPSACSLSCTCQLHPISSGGLTAPLALPPSVGGPGLLSVTFSPSEQLLVAAAAQPKLIPLMPLARAASSSSLGGQACRSPGLGRAAVWGRQPVWRWPAEQRRWAVRQCAAPDGGMSPAVGSPAIGEAAGSSDGWAAVAVATQAPPGRSARASSIGKQSRLTSSPAAADPSSAAWGLVCNLTACTPCTPAQGQAGQLC